MCVSPRINLFHFVHLTNPNYFSLERIQRKIDNFLKICANINSSNRVPLRHSIHLSAISFTLCNRIGYCAQFILRLRWINTKHFSLDGSEWASVQRWFHSELKQEEGRAIHNVAYSIGLVLVLKWIFIVSEKQIICKQGKLWNSMPSKSVHNDENGEYIMENISHYHGVKYT